MNIGNIIGTTFWLLIILAIVFLYKLVKNENSRFKNEKVKETFDNVVEIAFRNVVALMQTTVKELKENGKWDKDIAIDIFNQALTETKYQLGKEGMELLKEKVSDVDAYLTNLIESIVYETKINEVEGIDIKKVLELVKKDNEEVKVD